MTLPRQLYRGDADKSGRRLRGTIKNNQYQTNLINGGEGRIIFETPLINLIDRHVAIGWKETHFLSFTEDILTAYRYGSGNNHLAAEEIEMNFIDYYDDGDDWEFALLTLHTENAKWNHLEPGVYEGFYKPGLVEFSGSKDYRIILLHVASVLSNNTDPSLAEALSNATRDNEWLLLPATIKLFNNNRYEYSAILDGGNLVRYQKIKAF